MSIQLQLPTLTFVPNRSNMHRSSFCGSPVSEKTWGLAPLPLVESALPRRAFLKGLAMAGFWAMGTHSISRADTPLRTGYVKALKGFVGFLFSATMAKNV